MALHLKFKHLTNTYKPFAGVDHKHCAPKPQILKQPAVDGNNRAFTAEISHFDPKNAEVVTLVLHSENLKDLTEAEKKFPEARQRIIMARNEADYERRLSANEAIRADLQRYVAQEEIEILGEEEVDEEKKDAKKGKKGEVITSNLADIKSDDFSARGIPTPAALKS
jgi:hypothetical protein